jgi:hypothetical protein
MLANVLDNLKRERAEFARNVEYLRETANDDLLDDRMDVAESLFVKESYDELVEAANMVNEMSDEEEVEMESAEIDKIMNSTENISFNEMIGIE